MKADPEKLKKTRDEGICPMCGKQVEVWIFDGPAAHWSTYTCKACGYQLREHVTRKEA